MKRKNGVTRRQALVSIATLTASTLLKPASILGATPVNNRIRFGVIGDWGTGDGHCIGIADQMLEVRKRNPFDFVITAGDNIYPNGSGKHFLKNFERPYARLLRDGVNFHAALGNHDVDAGRRDQCQYPLFNMGGHSYYTLKKGDGLIEFFMLDSTDFDSTQTGWLTNALSNSTAKWKIAAFHHPLYSSAKKHGSDEGLREKLEPIFARYGVNLVFSGHDHTYERVKPQQGIHYFVTGGGGKVRKGDIDHKSPFVAASYDQDNHFMVVEIEDSRARFAAISETGEVVDQGEINQTGW
jgi:hypothetical protein